MTPGLTEEERSAVRVRMARERLTQRELGRRLGIAQSGVSRAMNGHGVAAARDLRQWLGSPAGVPSVAVLLRERARVLEDLARLDKQIAHLLSS